MNCRLRFRIKPPLPTCALENDDNYYLHGNPICRFCITFHTQSEDASHNPPEQYGDSSEFAIRPLLECMVKSDMHTEATEKGCQDGVLSHQASNGHGARVWSHRMSSAPRSKPEPHLHDRSHPACSCPVTQTHKQHRHMLKAHAQAPSRRQGRGRGGEGEGGKHKSQAL